MLIAIEGLPGSGKTTSAGLLAERIGGSPLIETTPDHPFLHSVYDDHGRHDLQVELAFLLLHFGGYRSRPHQGLVVSDFSPVKDRLFARDMLRGDDLDLFERVYERMYADEPLPDLALYLDLSPEDCLARVRERGREFESGMALDRLRRMRDLYHRYLEDLAEEVAVVPLRLGPSPKTVADRLASILAERDVIAR